MLNSKFKLLWLLLKYWFLPASFCQLVYWHGYKVLEDAKAQWECGNWVFTVEETIAFKDLLCFFVPPVWRGIFWTSAMGTDQNILMIRGLLWGSIHSIHTQLCIYTNITSRDYITKFCNSDLMGNRDCLVMLIWQVKDSIFFGKVMTTLWAGCMTLLISQITDARIDDSSFSQQLT